MESLEELKGIMYLDIPNEIESEVDLAQAMKRALDWNRDPVVDSNENK